MPIDYRQSGKAMQSLNMVDENHLCSITNQKRSIVQDPTHQTKQQNRGRRKSKPLLSSSHCFERGRNTIDDEQITLADSRLGFFNQSPSRRRNSQRIKNIESSSVGEEYQISANNIAEEIKDEIQVPPKALRESALPGIHSHQLRYLKAASRIDEYSNELVHEEVAIQEESSLRMFPIDANAVQEVQDLKISLDNNLLQFKDSIVKLKSQKHIKAIGLSLKQQ